MFSKVSLTLSLIDLSSNFFPINADNDIDGETFMLLEEKDIDQLVQSVGAKRKLIIKRRQILEPKQHIAPALKDVYMKDAALKQRSASGGSEVRDFVCMVG